MGVFRRRRQLEAQDESPTAVVEPTVEKSEIQTANEDSRRTRINKLFEYREDRSPSEILQAAYHSIEERDVKLVSKDDKRVSIDECILRAACKVLDLNFNLDRIDSNYLKCSWNGADLQNIVDYIYLRDTGYWWRRELSADVRKCLRIDERRQDEVAEKIMDILRESWECCKRDRDIADPEIPTNITFHCTDGNYVRAHKCIFRSMRNLEALYCGQERACVDRMLRAKKNERVEIPVSSTALKQLLDFGYTSWLEFEANSAAGLYILACMFGPSMANLERHLIDVIADNWDLVMASREFHRLPITRITILCKNEKFRPRTALMGKSMERQLRKWMRRCPEKRTQLWEELFELLNQQFEHQFVNASECFYQTFQNRIYRFNGCFWSHITDRPGVDPTGYSYMYGVLSPRGEMIVADIDGPIGLLERDGSFVKHNNYLPHDPLEWGYPFVFDNHSPYLCLVFKKNIGHREILQLWIWRTLTNRFEAIFTPGHTVENVIEMQRHHTDEHVFFIVATVTSVLANECTVNVKVKAGNTARRSRLRITASENSQIQRHGIFRMTVIEKEIFTGKFDLLENWTKDQYSNWYGNLRHFCNTLYKTTRRIENREEINVFKYDNASRKFIPLPCWFPSAREKIFTLGDRCFLIAYDVGKGNWDVPRGFYEYDKKQDRWIDITVPSNFMAISGW